MRIFDKPSIGSTARRATAVEYPGFGKNAETLEKMTGNRFIRENCEGATVRQLAATGREIFWGGRLS